MGAIHELREDYRHFRVEHPRLRGLFLLGDIISLLIKLALIGGFLFMCWYIVSRDPQQQNTTVASAENQTPVVVAESTTELAQADNSPELTDERIAILREIAGQSDSEISRNEALLGSAPAASADAGDFSQRSINTAANTDVIIDPESGQLAAVASDVTGVLNRGPVQTIVQVESFRDRSEFAGYLELEDIPTAEEGLPSGQVAGQVAGNNSQAIEFSEDVFIPSTDIENGSWVLEQEASDFTVQLALTINVEFLVDYARKLPTEHVAAIYPERRNAKDDIQYSLSLGSFPTKRSAEAALAALSADLRRYGAHTRNFDEVQANTSAFLR